jgi:uncharacterized tellurite resistance protein B-like protein
MDTSQHLRNLLVMALADGSLSEREVNFITDRCAELGLGEEELRESLRYALEDQAALSLPKDPAAQEMLLTDLVRMMAADGSLAENEKRLFALAAAKLGFGDEKLDALFNRLTAK